MASVAQKLSQYRASQKKDDVQAELERIKTMPLEELANERISFGKTKVGQKFVDVFEDNQWTDWFVGTYEKSPKIQHQMFVQYVLKRLDQEIIEDKAAKKNAKSEKMKDYRATASAESDVWDQISETAPVSEFEMPNVMKVQQVEEQVLNLSMENKNLASRLTNMEMAMQEVLQHVRRLSVKSEP
eukprot:s4904_g2.t1